MLDALNPIGSVVRLDGQENLFVILGFYPNDGEMMYDYLAAPYPAGLADESSALFLNAGAITEIVAQGYLDEQGQKVLAATVELMNAQEAAYIAKGKALEEAGESQGGFQMA